MSWTLSIAISVGFVLAFFFGYLKGKERLECKIENILRLVRRIPYYHQDPALRVIRKYLGDEEGDK